MMMIMIVLSNISSKYGYSYWCATLSYIVTVRFIWHMKPCYREKTTELP